MTGTDPINITYIPHTVKRLPAGRNHGPQQTNFSLRKFAQIELLASDTPVIDQKAEIYRERLSLHHKSQAKVKNWGNTIWGTRMQRIAAAEERERLLEGERKRVDAEWAKVQDAEKAAFINRARMLQMYEDPRVRDLHSQMLMSNVLKERDLQLEYKAKRLMAEKIQEKEEALRLRKNYLDGEKEERLKHEKEVQKRLDFAKGLKAGVESKKGISGKSKADQASIDAITAKIAEEYRKENQARRLKQQREASSMAQALDQQLLEKKTEKAEKDQELQELDEHNQRFNKMKYKLEEKRKEMIKQQATTRMQRSEVVAEISRKEIEEAEKSKAAFLKAMQESNAVQGRSDLKKASAQKAFMSEKEEFERLHLKKEAIRNESNTMKALERMKYEREAEMFSQECQAVEEKKKAKILAVKNEQLEQMKAKAAKKDVHEEETTKYDDYTEMKQTSETAAFDAYASECIEQFSKEGKNVKILMHAIEKDRKRNGNRPKPADHISQVRLG